MKLVFYFLAICSSALLAGWGVLGVVLTAFPPANYPIVVWFHVFVLVAFYGLVALIVIWTGLPDGRVERGICRITFFGFGVVLISRRHQSMRIESMLKWRYPFWRIGSNWTVWPSFPSWLIKLVRIWRRK